MEPILINCELTSYHPTKETPHIPGDTSSGMQARIAGYMFLKQAKFILLPEDMREDHRLDIEAAYPNSRVIPDNTSFGLSSVDELVDWAENNENPVGDAAARDILKLIRDQRHPVVFVEYSNLAHLDEYFEYLEEAESAKAMFSNSITENIQTYNPEN